MRRRGFTLVEVTVVCAILAMVAAVALPNVVAMKANQERKETYNELLRLAQLGREVAISGGRTYVLSFDGSTTLALNPEEEAESMRDTRTSNNTSADSSDLQPRPLPTGIFGGGQSSPSSMNSSGGRNEDGTDASVSLPTGVSVGQINLGSQSSSTSDFKLHFFPDGRSEGGGFEMIDGSTTRTLTVDRNGIARLEEGDLPAANEEKWEAGQYEQRSSS